MKIFKTILPVVFGAASLTGCRSTCSVGVVTDRLDDTIVFHAIYPRREHYVMYFDYQCDSVTSRNYYESVRVGDTLTVCVSDIPVPGKMSNLYHNNGIDLQRILLINGGCGINVVNQRTKDMVTDTLNKNMHVRQR